MVDGVAQQFNAEAGDDFGDCYGLSDGDLYARKRVQSVRYRSVFDADLAIDRSWLIAKTSDNSPLKSMLIRGQGAVTNRRLLRIAPYWDVKFFILRDHESISHNGRLLGVPGTACASRSWRGGVSAESSRGG